MILNSKREVTSRLCFFIFAMTFNYTAKRKQFLEQNCHNLTLGPMQQRRQRYGQGTQQMGDWKLKTEQQLGARGESEERKLEFIFV